VNTEVIQSGKYPLTRRLVVVVKQDGQIDQQAGEAYAHLLLTTQGQELIEKAGLVPIR
jgi:phosphate transport system substrate-binding protein